MCATNVDALLKGTLASSMGRKSPRTVANATSAGTAWRDRREDTSETYGLAVCRKRREPLAVALPFVRAEYGASVRVSMEMVSPSAH